MAEIKILLVEDDEEMRRMIATALREDGHEVVGATDGGEALVQLASAALEPFDLVVCDIRMPVYSGLHILHEMRLAGWSIPVICMTAFGDRATREAVEGEGGFLFQKPFDVDDLRTAVLHLARHRRALSAGRPLDVGPAVELVATREGTLDAWFIKWTLQAEGIPSYIGRVDAQTTNVYVTRRDAQNAHAVIRRIDPTRP